MSRCYRAEHSIHNTLHKTHVVLTLIIVHVFNIVYSGRCHSVCVKRRENGDMTNEGVFDLV